jgi:hypothetical protein
VVSREAARTAPFSQFPVNNSDRYELRLFTAGRDASRFRRRQPSDMLAIMKFRSEILESIEFNTNKDIQALELMKAIYPDASEAHLQEGLEALKDYLRLAVKIMVRVMREDPKALTGFRRLPTMQTERSNPININKRLENL